MSQAFKALYCWRVSLFRFWFCAFLCFLARPHTGYGVCSISPFRKGKHVLYQGAHDTCCSHSHFSLFYPCISWEGLFLPICFPVFSFLLAGLFHFLLSAGIFFVLFVGWSIFIVFAPVVSSFFLFCSFCFLNADFYHPACSLSVLGHSLVSQMI